MQITTGKIASAQKLVLYAPEGFGKSTFASRFPDPLYIDTEDGTKQLDVKRFDADMRDWSNILNAVDYVIEHPDSCKTLVIDTIDWAEMACITKLNTDYKTANILTMDYGKGSQYVQGEMALLFVKLDALIRKGIHVVLLAHAVMRKLEVPEEMGAFDHWELKLQSKQVKAMVKEWADLLLFGNYKTYVVTDDKTKSKKAQGGKRALYTEHHACWDAKNRHGLPSEIDFDYKAISHLFEQKKPAEGKKESKKEAPKEVTKEAPKAKQPSPVEPASEAKVEEMQTAPEQVQQEQTDQPDAVQNPIEKKLREFMEKAHFTEDEIIVTFHEKGKLMECKSVAEITDWDFIEKNVLGNWLNFSKAVQKYGVDNPFAKHWKKEDKKDGRK